MGGDGGAGTLQNNWSVCAPSTYKRGFVRVNTLPGERTYAEIYNSGLALPGNASVAPLELVELPKQGPLRGTGKLMQNAAYKQFIDDDGNLAYWVNTRTYAGAPVISHAYMQQLQEVNDLPSWGPQKELANVSSGDTSSSLAGPFGFNGWGMMMFPKATTGGYFHHLPYRSNATAGQSAHRWSSPSEAIDGAGVQVRKLRL